MTEYVNEVLSTESSDLVAYWQLSETAGTEADDSASGDYDGTYDAAVALAQLDNPQADGRQVPYFDGSGGVDIYSSALNTAFDGENGTIAGWFKMDAAAWSEGSSGSMLTMQRFREDINNRVEFRAYTDSRYELLMIYVIDGDSLSHSLPFEGPLDAWFHLAITYQKESTQNVVKFYFNGELIITKTTSTQQSWTTNLSTSETSIGHNWKGHIADLAVWKQALDAADILELATYNPNLSLSGRLTVGDIDETADALIEAHNLENASLPRRGSHIAGILSGALNSVTRWVMNQLTLRGTDAVDATHSAFHSNLTNENTGVMNANASLRAGTFELVNRGGSVGDGVTEAIGVQIDVENESGGHVESAYGLKVDMTNSGTVSGESYAIHTEGGIAYLGEVSNTPATNPSSGAYLYVKASDGRLYVRDAGGERQV